MVKLRLQRKGRTKAPFYHIVAAHVDSPRDGKFIERVGTYNPTTIPAQITIEVDRAIYWLQNGAQPTATVNAILRYKGVLYKKHLLRGVTKGSFSLEVAETKFEEWIDSHKSAVMDHVKKIEGGKEQIKLAEMARLSAKRDEKEKVAQKIIDDAVAATKATENITAVEESVVAEVASAEEPVVAEVTAVEEPVVAEVAAVEEPVVEETVVTDPIEEKPNA